MDEDLPFLSFLFINKKKGRGLEREGKGKE